MSTVHIVTVIDTDSSTATTVTFSDAKSAQQFMARVFLNLVKEYHGETDDDDSLELEESVVEAYENEDYELVISRAMECDDIEENFQVSVMERPVLNHADEFNQEELPKFNF